jgi:hypothetical protein
MSRTPNPERAAELSALLAQRYPAARPYLLARAIVGAQRAALRAKARAERACTYGEDEAADARCEAAFAAAIREALALDPTEEAPRITLGGDPRGPCGYLHIPGLRGDGWGEGFALY